MHTPTHPHYRSYPANLQNVRQFIKIARRWSCCDDPKKTFVTDELHVQIHNCVKESQLVKLEDPEHDKQKLLHSQAHT